MNPSTSTSMSDDCTNPEEGVIRLIVSSTDSNDNHTENKTGIDNKKIDEDAILMPPPPPRKRHRSNAIDVSPYQSYKPPSVKHQSKQQEKESRCLQMFFQQHQQSQQHFEEQTEMERFERVETEKMMEESKEEPTQDQQKKANTVVNIKNDDSNGNNDADANDNAHANFHTKSVVSHLLHSKNNATQKQQQHSNEINTNKSSANTSTNGENNMLSSHLDSLCSLHTAIQQSLVPESLLPSSLSLPLNTISSSSSSSSEMTYIPTSTTSNTDIATTVTSQEKDSEMIIMVKSKNMNRNKKEQLQQSQQQYQMQLQKMQQQLQQEDQQIIKFEKRIDECKDAMVLVPILTHNNHQHELETMQEDKGVENQEQSDYSRHHLLQQQQTQQHFSPHQLLQEDYEEGVEKEAEPTREGNGNVEQKQQNDEEQKVQHGYAEENEQAQKFDKPFIQTRFSDIIGHGRAKLRLDEMLLPLALPPPLAQSILTGVRAAPASILLYGPPGTGKTQLAKAVAGEAQAAFMSIGPSDVLSKFVGESEQSVKALFEEAKNKAKRMESQCTVLFFDEIDALGISRNNGGSGGDSGNVGGNGNMPFSGGEQSSRRVLAELLIQLSNLSSSIDDGDSLSSDCERGFDGNESNEEPICGLTMALPNHSITKEKEEIKKCRLSNEICVTYSQESNEKHQPHYSCEEDRDIKIGLHENIEEDHCCPNPISPVSRSPKGFYQDNNNIEGSSQNNPRIIVIAATNRPEDCDPALLRRFAIRVLIGLPTRRDRRRIIYRLLKGIQHTISSEQLKDISNSMEGWSGSDLESVTREAVMAPVRECLRSAAILKMRTRRQFNRMINSNENKEKCKNFHYVDRGNEMARNELLNRFNNLRPVSIHDFQEAISFWIGDGQEGVSMQMMNDSRSCHYDSDSSTDEDE